MNLPKVVVVVVNWNKAEHLLRCLESLYQITYPNYDVIVMDNASEDDSIEKAKNWVEGIIPVESRYVHYKAESKPSSYRVYKREEVDKEPDNDEETGNPSPVKRLIVIQNEQNFRGTTANNIGAKHALANLKADYILLIHNDCVVAPDFLDKLIDAANNVPNAGVLGPKICSYADPEGIPWSEGGLINWWRGTYLQRGSKLAALSRGKEFVPVDWVPTCCALISRQVYNKIGFIDEVFQFGNEEVDLCIRACKQGFKILFVPKSQVWHDDTRTPDYQKKVLNTQIYHIPKGRGILLFKHWRGVKRITALSYYALQNIHYLFNFLLHSRNWSHLKLYWRGLLDSWKERKRTSTRSP